MNKHTTIGVIGIGRLGLSFALLCESKGYNIIGCDTRIDYVDSLNAKSYTTVEPGINQLLQSSTNFTATTDYISVCNNCDIIFCFVATPSLPDGSYDHSAIDNVVDQLYSVYNSGIPLIGKILVIGCTTMPGYIQTIAERLRLLGVWVAYNPEFIAQGDIINGLRNADMVLMGVQEESTYLALQSIYRTIMSKEPIINKMSPTAAEITKISINCFLTMKIAYANMIGEVAINSDIEDEVSTILKAIGSDSRIGTKFLNYGHGYSGVCLPRDNRALGVYMEDMGIKARMLTATDNANNAHLNYLVDYLIKQNSNKDYPFLISQLAYKKGVDILTDSAPLELCRKLLELGYRVDITESPTVVEQAKVEFAYYADRITWGQVTKGYKINI